MNYAKVSWTDKPITEGCAILVNKTAKVLVAEAQKIFTVVQPKDGDRDAIIVALEPFYRLFITADKFIDDTHELCTAISEMKIEHAEEIMGENPDKEFLERKYNISIVSNVAGSAVIKALRLLENNANEAESWRDIENLMPMFIFISAIAEHCLDHEKLDERIENVRKAVLMKELFLTTKEVF